MPPGRNTPCPCGSGRKYKSCCLYGDLERKAEQHLAEQQGQVPSSETLFADPEVRAQLKASARRDRTWEAAAIPLPSAIESDPECRPVVMMVGTRDAVLALDSLERLSGETEAVASAIHQVLEDAMRLTGTRPSFLNVAHVEVALALTPLLEGSGIQVEALGGLDRLHDPARAMVEDLSGVDLWPPMSRPESWAAWQLPDAEVAALFRAAADFYRGAPWTSFSDGIPLAFEPDDGSTWAGAVMGQAGQTYGLALYENPDDLFRFYGDEPPAGDGDDLEVLNALTGRVLTLLFDEARDLPRPMRREVARKGWEVASPSAYPILIVMNTPGGGLSLADLRWLTEALTLVPRFLAETERAEADGTWLPEWRNPETGTLVYSLFGDDEVGVPLALEPGYARGPAAEPGAFLTLEEGTSAEEGEGLPPDFVQAFRTGIDIVNEFGMALERKGMGEATIVTHVRNAADFLRFLVTVEAVPLTGIHERDLLGFLMDWHPRNFDGGLTRARRMPVSLDRFFEFLDSHIGLQCPWASEILAERDLIELRLEEAPRGDIMDPEVRAWRAPHMQEVDMRLLRPALEEVQASIREMDPDRAVNLLRELGRSWLLWRDEFIESGLDEASDELWDRLLERQRSWMEERGIG